MIHHALFWFGLVVLIYDFFIGLHEHVKNKNKDFWEEEYVWTIVGTIVIWIMACLAKYLGY